MDLMTILLMWAVHYVGVRYKQLNTKPQIYYNNNNAGTPQASKRKKRQFR